MPDRKYKVTTIQIKCGDCGVMMQRVKDPVMQKHSEHIVSRCPNCKMEITNYKNTFLVVTGKRPYLQIDWGMSMEEKEAIYQDQLKKKEMREKWDADVAELNRQMEEEYRKDQAKNEETKKEE